MNGVFALCRREHSKGVNFELVQFCNFKKNFRIARDSNPWTKFIASLNKIIYQMEIAHESTVIALVKFKRKFETSQLQWLDEIK